jgi:oligopeptide/dipeptide ABC transporter ATP-binding protein
MSALLKVRGLTKKFAVRSNTSIFSGLVRSQSIAWIHALEDVSFDLMRGEALGIVGESGSGKSTLALVIARLAEASSGSIFFGGKDIGKISVSAFASSGDRAKIQMVFQDPVESLNPRFTAFDSISDPIRALKRIRDAAEIKIRVESAASRVSLPKELLPRYPHQMSGGQLARVGIGRAISVEPELIVLDEPTSPLDVSTQATILRLLAELRTSIDISYVLVSHDLNVVRMLCDRVLVMYLGKTMECGPAKEVFANPRHPYTAALVEAIPGRNPQRRTILEGEAMSPVNPDPCRCRFYGRCSRGTEKCANVAPELESISPTREVACHFPLRT